MGLPKGKGNPLWKKGVKNPGQGRPKGVKNKLTVDVVQNILNVAEHLASTGQSLQDRAKLNPDWYYEHFYKPLVPKNINLSGELNLEVEIFIGPKKIL